MYRSVVIPGSPSIPRARWHVHVRLRTTLCRPIFTASGSSSLESSWSWSDSTSGVVLAPFFFLSRLGYLALGRIFLSSVVVGLLRFLVRVEELSFRCASLCSNIKSMLARAVWGWNLLLDKTPWVSLCTSSVRTSTTREANGASTIGGEIEGTDDGGMVDGNRVSTASCGDCFPLILAIHTL